MESNQKCLPWSIVFLVFFACLLSTSALYSAFKKGGPDKPKQVVTTKDNATKKPVSYGMMAMM